LLSVLLLANAVAGVAAESVEGMSDRHFSGQSTGAGKTLGHKLEETRVSATRTYRVIVAARSLTGEGSTAIYVDGEKKADLPISTYSQAVFAGRTAFSVDFEIGSTHTIAVDQAVGEEPYDVLEARDRSEIVLYDQRYYCENDFQSVTSKADQIVWITFEYVKQYRLNVISLIDLGGGEHYYDARFGGCKGAGWFVENSVADFSVGRVEVTTNDGKFVFVGWETMDTPDQVDAWQSKRTSWTVVMFGSWTIVALWERMPEHGEQDTATYAVLAVIAISGVVAASGALAVRSRRRRTAIGMQSCVNCGHRLPSDAAFCDACGKRQSST
jgi:hypothetical protein